MDLNEAFREPVEVYEAADGNGEALAQRIESGANMTKWERAALAAFFRGELVPPKRGRGQQTLPHLAARTKDNLKRKRIKSAVGLLRFHMRDLRKRGLAYGNFLNALDHVADELALTADEAESVAVLYRKPEKKKELKNYDINKEVVKNYQLWLLNTGRLPDFPQPVDSWYEIWLRDGRPDLRKWVTDQIRSQD
jgi:hypothetical protein